MKSLWIFCLTLFSLAAHGKNKLDQTEHLALYGQVWGFLKYFHPSPGTHNWDHILLNDFSLIKSCENDSSFNLIISKMIDKCGTYTPMPRSVKDSMRFDNSFTWINNPSLSNENRAYLAELYKNKPRFKNKYINQAGAGNPKIINELDYGEYKFNKAINFLALTRYWNIINYYCPNRELIPEDWTTIYKEYIPIFDAANTFEKYYFYIRQLTAEIRDGHGFIHSKNDPMSSYRHAPFYCLSVSDGYYITHVWQDSLHPFNLQRTDKIILIDGIPVEEKMHQIGKMISTSNDYYLSKSTYYLSISDQDSIQITIERNGVLIDQTLSTIDQTTLKNRYPTHTPHKAPPPYRFLKDSVSQIEYCYVNMGRLKRKDINSKFKRKLRKTEHLIIDSRNYPNWTLLELCRVLIKGRTTFAKFAQIDFDYPGSFKWTKSQTIGNRTSAYQGKIYVLVDYNTMSQAEYTVMALQQHPNTIVIGGQTAGADGNISGIPLPFGVESVFSGLGVFYLDGRPTQQVGIDRDIKVVQDKSHIEGLEDLIFNKTLDLIRN